jgi:hypothetical protein
MQLVIKAVPILLLCFCFFGFWHFWKKVCATPKPRRDFLILTLIPFLSPLMLGVTWWHFPEQGGNWNIWFIILPFMVSIAMFSYSVHAMANGRYRLLSVLAMVTSGPVALLEGIGASVLVLFGRTN